MKIDYSLITLAPANDTHSEFLFQLKKVAMGPYVKKIWGWNEQHQRERFDEDRRAEPPWSIIAYDQQPIGSILVWEIDNHTHFKHFYLLPKFQNQGIGSHVLGNELKKADKAKKATSLAVLKINPALSLYKRLGFQINGNNEYQYLMERQPGGKTKEYKAVIFDLYGTLVENFPAHRSRENLITIAGIVGVNPDEFIAAWRQEFNNRMVGKVKSHRDNISKLCRQLGAKPTDALLDKAATVRFIINQQEVMSSKPHAVEVLTTLKANGIKTALLSNCSLDTSAIWPSTELAPLLDFPVMSAVEKIMKPDPRLFRIALKRLGLKADQCLYVADGMGQELTIAAKLGMTAVRLDVPYDSEYEHDRENWQGITITSLKEILNLL